MSSPRPQSEEWDPATGSSREVPRHHRQYWGDCRWEERRRGLGWALAGLGRLPWALGFYKALRVLQ